MGESDLIAVMWARATQFAKKFEEIDYDIRQVYIRISPAELYALAAAAGANLGRDMYLCLFWLHAQILPKHICCGYGAYYRDERYKEAREKISRNTDIEFLRKKKGLSSAELDVEVPYKLLEELVNVCLKSKDG